MHSQWRAILLILVHFTLRLESVGISSVVPNWSSHLGGTLLNISGNSFVQGGNLSCVFGGSLFVKATFISFSTLQCVSPARSQLEPFVPDVDGLLRNNTVSLQVSQGLDISRSVLFFFSEVPSVSSLVPTEGPTYGTTMVNVSGVNFLDGPTLQCRFGDLSVPAQYESGGALSCSTPPSAGIQTVTFNTQPEVLGYAMKFDGVNDFLTQGFDQAFNLTRDMTFEVWFKLESLATTQASSSLVEDCYPGESFATNCMYYAEITPDGGLLVGHEYGEGINQEYKFDLGIMAKRWYHLAFVRDASIKRYTIFLNGVAFNTTYDYTFHPDGGPTGIYVGAYYTTLFLNGWMDELRLWSVVRSQEQIVSNMHLALYGNETGLNGYWPFDDNQGIVTPDLSPYGNEMLLGGTTAAYAPFRDTVAVDGDWSGVELAFTFYEPEIVTDIQPKNGPFEGGTHIRVLGNGFRNNSYAMCKFGTGYGVQATFVSPTELICDSFSSRCGNAPITSTSVEVSNNGQQFSKGNNTFSFYDTPNVVSISPFFGSSIGGTTVTVLGQNLVSGDNITCRFGTTVVPALVISPTTVSCVSPERGELSDVVTLEISPNGQQYTVNAQLWRYQDLVEMFVDSTSVIGIIFVVCAAVLILVTIPIGAVAYYSKEKGVIKQSNLMFLFFILTGVVLSYSVIFFWAQRPSEATCLLRIWSGGLGFILITGPLFVKTFWTWKVAEISAKSLHPMKLSNGRLLVPLIPVIVVEVLILVLWSAVNPLVPMYQNEDVDANQVQVVCQSDNFVAWLCVFFIWKGIILLIGAYLAFRTRALSSKFGESKNIAVTIYNFLFVGVLLLPIIFIVQMTPGVRFAISCITLLWVVTFTLIVMLGSKMWIVFSKAMRKRSQSDSTSHTL